MAFELPPLPYDYEALQPYMSKETLEYHHDKHHKAYVDNGNKLPGKLQTAIDKDLGGYDKFKADFVAAGTTQFGSGWAWLSVKNGKLEISKTPNGENPLVHGGAPILGVDVWEHSYYIDYRNARPKYLEAFVDNLINWDYVLELYEKAK